MAIPSLGGRPLVPLLHFLLPKRVILRQRKVRTDNYVGHLPMHESHACVITTRSASTTSVAARRNSPFGPPKTVGVDFQPTTGQSNTRSPCVSGGASTTSYQLSFIGTVSRASIGIDQRFQAGQFVSSELDLFREQHCTSTWRREDTSNRPICVGSRPSVQHARGSFATSMLEFRTWLERSALPPSSQSYSPERFCYPRSRPRRIVTTSAIHAVRTPWLSCLFAYHLRGLFPAV